MTAASAIRERLNQCNYNQEYSADIFRDIAKSETIKKTLQRSGSLIGKTTTKKFYRKYRYNDTSLSPYLVYDDQEMVQFDPSIFSFNAFWQTAKPSTQKASAVIRNYLATMHAEDIKKLCQIFGRNRVKRELILKYKVLYKQGFIDVKGMKVPLHGRYDRNPIFKELVGVIDDC